MTHRRLQVLVIDDSAPYLDFMRILLSTEDYDVVTATSLQEAQPVLLSGQVDLVIADALLPGLPPFAVLDLLRQQPQTRDVPVLLCTGALLEVKAARDRLQEENIAVLFKPFDIDELAARMAALTGHLRETS